MTLKRISERLRGKFPRNGLMCKDVLPLSASKLCVKPERMGCFCQLRTLPQVQPKYLQPLGALRELAFPKLAHNGALAIWKLAFFFFFFPAS